MTTRQPTVLVGIDGSPAAENALAWAVDYVRRHNGRLRLVTAWSWPTFQGKPIQYGRYNPERSARTMLRSVATECGVPRELVEVVVTKGSAPHILLEEAKAADLLVVGSRGLGGFSRLMIGSTSSACVHHSPCPVAIVRTKATQHHGAGVVVGVDDSDYSKQALRWAMDHVSRSAEQLTVVTVTEAPPAWLPTRYAVPGTHTPGTGTPEIELWLEELVEKELALRPAPLAHKPRRIVLEGNPAGLMVDMSAEANLVVVGSHGSGLFRRAVLGSVSSALALHGDCSVVVVREHPGHEI